MIMFFAAAFTLTSINAQKGAKSEVAQAAPTTSAATQPATTSRPWDDIIAGGSALIATAAAAKSLFDSGNSEKALEKIKGHLKDIKTSLKNVESSVGQGAEQLTKEAAEKGMEGV